MSKMRINKIKIKNFRGYSGEKIFEFDDSTKLILISGVNGLGKTTLLDSIEWCFTGTIRRLREELSERKEFTGAAKEGYIKNLNSFNKTGEGKQTFVEVEVSVNNNIAQLKRSLNEEDIDEIKRNKDLPNGEFTINLVNEDLMPEEEREKIKVFLKNLGNSELFHKNICSYDKNIKLYSKSRKDLADLVYEYLYDKEKVKKYKTNLELSFKALEKKKGEIEKEIEQFKSSNEENDTKIKSITPINLNPENYPEKIYQTEKNIDEFNNITESKEKEAQLRTQIETLEKVKEFTEKIQYFIEAENYLKSLEKLDDYSDFGFIKEKYEKSIERYLSIFNLKISEYEKIHSKIDQLKNIGTELTKYKQLNYKDKISEILDVEHKNTKKLLEIIEKCVPLINEINALDVSEAENIIIELKSKVFALTSYQKTELGDTCPLCESENFKDVDIANNLDKTISLLSKKTEQKNNKIENLKNLIKGEFYPLVDPLISECPSRIKYIESIKRSLPKDIRFEEINKNLLAQKEEELINLRKKITAIESNYDFSEDNNYNSIWGIESSAPLENKMRAVDKKLKEFNSIKSEVLKIEFVSEFYKDIDIDVELMGFLAEKNLQQIPSQVKQIDIKIKFLKDLSKEDSFTKLITDCKKQIEKNLKNINQKQKEQEVIKTNIELLKNIKKEIETLITDTNKNIGETLSEGIKKTYKRISRHTNFEIDTKPGGQTKSSFEIVCKHQGGKEVQSSIVMSTGQITTVALSIFWALVNSKKDSKFRCYFLDDPIQSIDDLNILSFVDLLRTELTKNGNCIFDQMFITTCDNNLENLIRHKMRTFEVPYHLIKFNNYSEFENIKEGNCSS